jgi:hypothetical protein
MLLGQLQFGGACLHLRLEHGVAHGQRVFRIRRRRFFG